MLVLKMLQKAKRRVDGLMNQALGVPPPEAAQPTYAKGNWGPDRKRAIAGELMCDAAGAIWSACWRRGR